jgi:hypothetical protein
MSQVPKGNSTQVQHSTRKRKHSNEENEQKVPNPKIRKVLLNGTNQIIRKRERIYTKKLLNSSKKYKRGSAVDYQVLSISSSKKIFLAIMFMINFISSHIIEY